MSISTQSRVFSNLTYNDEIKENIVKSGGTIVFIKDNVIVATEISESQYRELLNHPHIDKMDVLPLKRYSNEGVKYTLNEKSNEIQSVKPSINTQTSNIG